MWNILKMADRRAKRTKIWDPGYYSAYVRYFSISDDARFLEFGLGSFGALCKISDVKIFKLMATAPPVFDQFEPNFYYKHVGNKGIQAVIDL